MYKIAFYKCKGRFLDLLIRWWTKSKYSHCEIVIDNYWYSSSPRDGGVRVKVIEVDNTNWDFVDVAIDINKLNMVYLSNMNKGYDWIGILFSHILPFNINSKNRMYCSEFCAEVLGINSNITPQELYNIVNKSNT